MSLLERARRYFDYAYNRAGFETDRLPAALSEHALQTARDLRGASAGPAVLIHGILPRSGTVYAGELLGLHPDLVRYPNQMWETPFLASAGRLGEAQRHFLDGYKQNRDRIAENDFLPLFGAAFLHFLSAYGPAGRRLLLKTPSVQYLYLFFTVFPHENLLILLRDGRDVVASTIKSWPHLRFNDVCRRWDRSARLILEFERRQRDRPGWLRLKYEDAVAAPTEFLTAALQSFDLDRDRYPFEQISSLPVIGSSTTAEAGYIEIRKPRQFNPVGRWTAWSGWKRSMFKLIAGKSLLALEYCRDLTW